MGQVLHVSTSAGNYIRYWDIVMGLDKPSYCLWAIPTKPDASAA